MSARRDHCRYRGILRHVLGLTNLPADVSGRGLSFVYLERCAPSIEVRIVSCTLTRSRDCKLIVVSKVESLLLSVGGTKRSIRIVGGVVR